MCCMCFFVDREKPPPLFIWNTEESKKQTTECSLARCVLLDYFHVPSLDSKKKFDKEDPSKMVHVTAAGGNIELNNGDILFKRLKIMPGNNHSRCFVSDQTAACPWLSHGLSSGKPRLVLGLIDFYRILFIMLILFVVHCICCVMCPKTDPHTAVFMRKLCMMQWRY